MLLAFISVLGVFFGYFVRRSLREGEEDMRRQVADMICNWEKEMNRISTDATTKLADVDAKQSEIKEIIFSSKHALAALEASAKAEAQKLEPRPGLTETAVAAIEADNSIPAPTEGQ
jgi:hypothetical protein